MAFRIVVLLAAVAAPLALFACLPLLAPAQSLDDRIRDKQSQIDSKRGRERVLSTDVAGYTRRIDGLQSEISVLQGRQVRLQTSLDRKRAELAQIQEDLRRERLRLARLRARLTEARVALAARLVELYKADQPDVVTVVLESNGFADLLERAEFMQRVSQQDARIIGIVVRAKAEAIATAKRLDRLEERARRVEQQIEGEVNEVAAIKGALLDRQARYADARSEKYTLLANTRDARQALEGDLASLEAQQAKIQAALAARSAGVTTTAGPVRSGGGALIWPLNGSISSGFGMRWGRLHAGVDIPAPVGTGLRAAAAGRVAIAGPTGGYGNYICIQHSGGLSTCYGHLSSIGVSIGTSVGQGQVIGASGNTGNSTGPHLHFETRVNGSPVDPMGYL